MCYHLVKQVLLSSRGKVRSKKTQGNCNIAKAAKSKRKIAANDARKFPEAPRIYISEMDTFDYCPQAYRVIIGSLSEWFTGLVVEPIDSGPVV
jgi:hypothetical protein